MTYDHWFLLGSETWSSTFFCTQWNSTTGSSKKQLVHIEQSLDGAEGVVNFDDIKTDPGRVGLDSVLREP